MSEQKIFGMARLIKFVCRDSLQIIQSTLGLAVIDLRNGTVEDLVFHKIYYSINTKYDLFILTKNHRFAYSYYPPIEDISYIFLVLLRNRLISDIINPTLAYYLSCFLYKFSHFISYS